MKNRWPWFSNWIVKNFCSIINLSGYKLTSAFSACTDKCCITVGSIFSVIRCLLITFFIIGPLFACQPFSCSFLYSKTLQSNIFSLLHFFRDTKKILGLNRLLLHIFSLLGFKFMNDILFREIILNCKLESYRVRQKGSSEV